MRVINGGILCLSILMTLTGSITAQEKMMTCSGVISDAQGQPVAGAKVEIKQNNPFTKNIETAYVQTDKSGRYEYSKIEWPYTVGVAWDQKTSVKGGRKLQYLRRNKVFDSSQKLDFKIGAFPTGSANLSGRVTDQHGKPFQNFTVRIHKKVDWNNFSGLLLVDYGYLLPFSSSDGKFDINDLPAGTYKITVLHPQKWDRYEFPKPQEVTLENNKTTNLTCQVFEKKAYYGRVLFDDGKAAYIDSPPWPGARTYVKLPSSQLGEIPAIIDREGYFTAYLTDTELEQLKNRESKISIYYPSYENKYLFVDHGMFPVELLSKEKSKAGAIKKQKAEPRIIMPAYSTRFLRNKPLPELYEFGIVLSALDATDKAILLCFFDYQQQPSRNCIQQLNKRAQELKAKDITVIAVQASKVERVKLDEWVKQNNIDFPVGMNWEDTSSELGTGKEEILLNWGVRSLPWLILTDKEQVVVTDKFSIDELNEKIKILRQK